MDSTKEKNLISKFEPGEKIQEIAAILERQPGVINSRLQKLGLKSNRAEIFLKSLRFYYGINCF